MRIASERGRTEYLMVSLVRGADDDGPLAAYPTAKGSGAVTAFSQADGFITIGQHVESVPAGHAGRGAVDRRCTPRRSRHHRQPLRRARCADRPAASRRDLGQGAQCRQHRRARRRQARRVRHRRHPSDGPGDRRIQPARSSPRRWSWCPAIAACKGSCTARAIRASRGVRSTRPSPLARCTRLPDGQPQRRQRHPHPDRPAARRREAARLLVAAEIAQRRRRRGRRKTEPIGASRSRPSPGNTGSASSRRRTSTTISLCPRRDLVAPRCSAFSPCLGTRRPETR